MYECAEAIVVPNRGCTIRRGSSAPRTACGWWDGTSWSRILGSPEPKPEPGRLKVPPLRRSPSRAGRDPAAICHPALPPRSRPLQPRPATPSRPPPSASLHSAPRPPHRIDQAPLRRQDEPRRPHNLQRHTQRQAPQAKHHPQRLHHLLLHPQSLLNESALGNRRRSSVWRVVRRPDSLAASQ
jgi:hypothetical protein